MNQAAYEINGQTVVSDMFYQVACDPRRSVVVEACAGAGKTWMLVSRILRALLDEVAPQHILAITFTKKAAGEMRERLHLWLREFARADEGRRQQELLMRGVPQSQLAELAPRLQALYERWLEDGRGVEIHTIHGWFSRLVKAAPLDVLHELGLPPELNLVEDTQSVWPELWGRFLRRLDAVSGEQDGPHPAFVELVRSVGRFNAENWLKTALSNRLELTLADQAGVLESSVETPAAWSARWAGLSEPCEALLTDSVREHFWQLARSLGAAKGKTLVDAGSALECALGLDTPQAQAEALRAALFTQAGEPRKKLAELEDARWAQDWLAELHQAQLQHDAHLLHGHMVTLSRVLFEVYAQLKLEQGLADMVDLELAAARLLSDPVLSGWIQERLDSQVRQLLMDEFQDTSPLQWQTLKSWLAGYAGAGGGLSGRQPIQVFLVGDPKQSIYRFRRADPRVFEAAKDFVIEALDGQLLACDHTRRNAVGVIEALNKVMGAAQADGVFQGFRPHTTDASQPGQLRVLPTVPRAAASRPTAGEGWRDTLRQPKIEAHTTIKELEAVQVAEAIAELLAQGTPPSDVFVLSRKRATLSLVAEALDEQGVPHIAPEDTLLVDVPEVRDLVAVMEVLVSPHHNLALAHALKSPMFGASDEDLLWLAGRVQATASTATWWRVLTSEAVQDSAPATLRRAAALLMRWSGFSTVLPPHDLLQRIVADSDCKARLLACVPPGRRQQALFHVDALLAHSLEMDGGRDATPYRWVRALKRLPLPLPPRSQSDAVQLLTIHGAKGLEAAIVFMVDTDPEPTRRDSYGLMVDWPEHASRPLRCAFLRSHAEPPPSLATGLLLDQQADQREELNALYVALTRAKSQLVFSRTEPRYRSSGSWWQRLLDCGAIDPDSMAWTPQGPATVSRAAPNSDSAPVLSVLPPLLPPREPSSVSSEGAPSPAQILGQVVHRVLEWMTAIPVSQRSRERLQRAVQTAARELGLPSDGLGTAHDLAAQILYAPSLQTWLDPQSVSWAGNEVTLHHQGQVLRIDRLVACDGPTGRHWWVLDYKLSHRPQDLQTYRQQLERYVEALSSLQPQDRVGAAFITSTGEWVELSVK